MRAAASRTFWTAGSRRPIRIAIIAITTSSSISVNADRPRPGGGAGEDGRMRALPNVGYEMRTNQRRRSRRRELAGADEGTRASLFTASLDFSPTFFRFFRGPED